MLKKDKDGKVWYTYREKPRGNRKAYTRRVKALVTTCGFCGKEVWRKPKSKTQAVANSFCGPNCRNKYLWQQQHLNNTTELTKVRLELDTIQRDLNRSLRRQKQLEEQNLILKDVSNYQKTLKPTVNGTHNQKVLIDTLTYIVALYKRSPLIRDDAYMLAYHMAAAAANSLEINVFNVKQLGTGQIASLISSGS